MILSSLGGSIYQFVIVLVIFIGVLVLTGFTTKWIANYMQNQTTSGNSNFEMVDAFNMGPGHRLQIIKVGKNKYYVLALNKESITLLGELSEEDLIPKSTDSSGSTSRNFNDILNKFHFDKQKQSK
ncbi:MAG: flagellar biosynthetic protein FliO [Lachnospiraceae bacterium]|nr:flagellar biosynthetic protein FliO [Lachnospiraceae bacterium]